MTKEEKQLLLKDFCARLLSGVRLSINGQMATLYGIDEDTIIATIDGKNYKEEFILSNGRNECDIVKPYLRPLESMTEEEKAEYHSLCYEEERAIKFDHGKWETEFYYHDTIESIDWLLAHHFDSRYLIENGLAIEAPEDMYKID